MKDKLIKPLYKNSFDGDSHHMYIRFENIQIIADELEEQLDDFTLSFYAWMKDNDAEEWFGFTDKDMLQYFKNNIYK